MRTFVLPYDPVVVREAILREYIAAVKRYVCPRIEDLDELRERLTSWCRRSRWRSRTGAWRRPSRGDHDGLRRPGSIFA